MRYKLVLAATALFVAIIAAFVYFFGPYKAGVALGVLTVRRGILRVATVLMLQWLPDIPRHWYERQLAHSKELCTWVWVHEPLPIRALLVLAAGLAAGFTIFLPVHVLHFPFGHWLQQIGLPYLLRTSAAKSVEAQLPSVWQKMPREVRRKYGRWYRHLWWVTARYAVRTEQSRRRKKHPVPR